MSVPVPKVAPWEDVVLRTIALYKILKAVLAIAAGLTLLTWVSRDLSVLLHQYFLVPLHYNAEDESESKLITWLLTEAESLTPQAKRFIAYTNFFYAALFLVEGVGLYLKKHWAEYVVIIVTASFLPFEVYWLRQHQDWWKFLLIAGNVIIMLFLIHRIRLDARRAAAKRLNAEECPAPASSGNPVSEVP